MPLLSKDGEIPEEEIEKWIIISRSSLDNTNTSITVSSSACSTASASTNSVGGGITNIVTSASSSNISELGVGGISNHFLGVTPGWLRQIYLPRAHFAEMSLVFEIEARLKTKCDKLSEAFQMDEFDVTEAEWMQGSPEGNISQRFLEGLLYQKSYPQRLSSLLYQKNAVGKRESNIKNIF